MDQRLLDSAERSNARAIARQFALPWYLFAAALALATWALWRAFGPASYGDPLATSLTAFDKANRLTVFSAQLAPVVAADDERLLGLIKSRQIAVRRRRLKPMWFLGLLLKSHGVSPRAWLKTRRLISPKIRRRSGGPISIKTRVRPILIALSRKSRAKLCATQQALKLKMMATLVPAQLAKQT
jgi:hypothetical protein